MLPELFRIPGFDVPVFTYGVLITVSFVVAICITVRLGVADEIPKSTIYDFALYIIPSALIGTRLLMILIGWREMSAGRQEVFGSVGHYFGGFALALVASVIFARIRHLGWYQIADASAPGLALGNVIGRLGCFSAGCCWGKPTNSWIGVRFSERAHQMNGVPIDLTLVPTQLLEAGANLVAFVLLLLLWRKKAFEGQVILAYIMLYCAERFLFEFWRADPRGTIMELPTSQFISVCMFPIIVPLYLWRRRMAFGRAPLGVSVKEVR